MAAPQWEERLRELEFRVADVERNHAVSTAVGKDIEKRLGSIEDTLRWLVRLIIGALLMAVLAFLIKGGFGA